MKKTDAETQRRGDAVKRGQEDAVKQVAAPPKVLFNSGQLGVRKGGLPPLLFQLLISLAVGVLCAAPPFAQQIGNPSLQQGVTPPRGTYAIRNARIVTLAGPEIENGT